jgi:hypothetical protein
MSEEEKSFREKLGSDIKTVKKSLYIEEFKSFVAAIGFAANVACLAIFPFTGLSLLNVLAVWFCLKQFKPTIKKQIVYHEHLKLLSTIKKDKVWTQGDKK